MIQTAERLAAHALFTWHNPGTSLVSTRFSCRASISGLTLAIHDPPTTLPITPNTWTLLATFWLLVGSSFDRLVPSRYVLELPLIRLHELIPDQWQH